jgi:hypothetical protein
MLGGAEARSGVFAEASRPLVFKPSLSCRALEQKGRLFNHVIILDQYGMDSAQVALGWIRLNEKGEREVMTGLLASGRRLSRACVQRS